MSSEHPSKQKPAIWYRERLLRKGETIRSWAIRFGYAPGTVYYAVHGYRQGPLSREIIRKLEGWLRG